MIIVTKFVNISYFTKKRLCEADCPKWVSLLILRESYVLHLATLAWTIIQKLWD